ncbi:MAG: phenylacetic acid degradation operon negative regulatory protein [Candidatus Berkelbacteria bacterium Licking1014_2]|uniref:Phenylacetic acid degradation operon negative regulatory protein n=1 Tax=Candidatus Berkelbacteria bacterium Licking1014_2 TaxID=2017146 RepID=A0A554LUB2_9BACT|nr:MAG: phenylacetic acid degradation operon negative regulatory protein [Candidatus Berkelbacteria bacterium Licking1014_2]
MKKVAINLNQFSNEELDKELQRRYNRERRKEITKEVLKTIAVSGAITIGILLAPNAVGAICRIIRDNRKRPHQERAAVKRAIDKLKKQNLIETKFNKKGETILSVTEKGRKTVFRYDLQQMIIPTPKNWDGRWRLVVFDIPEKQRKARNILRGTIQQLGFIQLQQSTWLYPYPCRKEIDFISHFYNIKDYVLYLETKDLDNPERFLEHFAIHT